MLCIRLERVTIEVLREEPLAKGDAVFLAHIVEAGGTPYALRCFNNERGCMFVEPVSVCLKPAKFSFFEGEREGVEKLVGAEPDEAAITQVDGGFVGSGVLVAHYAVGAVARD